jgi:hypothetical protein
MNFEYISQPSEYELKNIVWIGIKYDKEKLIEFLNKLKELKSLPKTNKITDEIRVMEDIYNLYDENDLQKLLNNDSDYSRWATVEKFSRRAAVEILLEGRYSKETFSIISNLPVVDFKLVMKRTKELIKTINETITESEMDTSKVSGVK